MHQLLAAVAKAPEIALSEEESKRLAEAAAGVARHYDLTASEKALDWGNLAISLGVIYGPRLFMISERRKKEREPPRPPTATIL